MTLDRQIADARRVYWAARDASDEADTAYFIDQQMEFPSEKVVERQREANNLRIRTWEALHRLEAAKAQKENPMPEAKKTRKKSRPTTPDVEHLYFDVAIHLSKRESAILFYAMGRMEDADLRALLAESAGG